VFPSNKYYSMACHFLFCNVSFLEPGWAAILPMLITSLAPYIVYGVVYICLGSVGNYVGCKRWWVPLLGALGSLNGVFLPYFTIERTGNGYLANTAVVLGCMIANFHIFHVLSILLPKPWIQARPIVELLLFHRPVSGAVHVKRAAAFKTSEMTNNALDIA
jgi:hypothetical protein